MHNVQNTLTMSFVLPLLSVRLWSQCVGSAAAGLFCGVRVIAPQSRHVNRTILAFVPVRLKRVHTAHDCGRGGFGGFLADPEGLAFGV